MRYFLLFLFVAMYAIFTAQKLNVQYIFAGQITNYDTGKKEGSVTATLTSGGKIISSVMTATNGKYQLISDLPVQSNFQIVFSKTGFVSKRVACNFSLMNTDRIKEGDKLTPLQDLSLELFTLKPGIDFSFLDQEAVATFGLNEDNILPKLDVAASQRIKQKIDGLLSNPTPQPDNSEANYNAAIKLGDNLLGQRKYEEALKQYENAAGIKPKEFYPQKKIAEIDALMKAQKNEKLAENETNKQYNNLVEAADNFRDNKQYPEALAKYNSALRVKYEQYPKDEIKKIEALVTEERKIDREDKSYQDAIAAADIAINAKNYKLAEERYQAALAIKTSEKYPNDQLAIVAAELSKIDQALEKKKKYDEAMQEANQLLAGSKYVEAKAKYMEASILFSFEPLPKEKIKICDELILKNSKKVKETQDIKRLFEEGQKLIDAKSYAAAKGKYQEILGIEAKTNLAQVKLDEIDRLIKSDEDARNAEKIIAAFIAEGDAAVKDQKYDIAKMKYGAALEVREDAGLREKYSALLSKIANLQAKTLVDQKFEESMNVAKALLDAGKLEEARRAYQAAANLNESRNEPKLRIAEIDAKLSKNSEADKAYRAIIDKGDALVKQEKYLAAIDEYNKALLIRSTDKEPKEKADEAERLERAKGDVENKQFEKIISTSREKIVEEDYDKAVELLNRAISLRSLVRKSDRRPEEMLAEIDKLKRIDQSYKEKIVSAEKFASEKNYDRAIAKFEEAASLKKKEELPNKRIEELKKMQSVLLGEAEKDNAYNDNFKKGLSAKAAKSYEMALENFNEALIYKTNNQAAKDQINEIKQIIEERKKLEESAKNELDRITSMLNEADALFNKGNWDEAKISYRKIVTIDKNQAHANARIIECESRLNEEINGIKNEEYKVLIDAADNNFEKKDFLQSKSLFENAKQKRPNDPYPTRKLKEIDLLLNPVVIESGKLESLGDVYSGDGGEALLVKTDLDRKNDKNSKFADAINEVNTQNKAYNSSEEKENFETKDAIGNAQVRGEKEALLAKEQVQRKNEYLKQIKDYGNDLNEQNTLYDQADSYQSKEKIKYVERNISEISQVQAKAYELNAEKIKDNSARINAMNDKQYLEHQTYNIQSAQALTKMSIEAQVTLNDDASRLATKAGIDEKIKVNEANAAELKIQEFNSTRQTTVGISETKAKVEAKAISQGQRLATNNEQVKAVERSFRDEGRKAYNREMEIYMQTKEQVNTQEKVGIRKFAESTEKTEATTLTIQAAIVKAESQTANLGKKERQENLNSQKSLDAIQLENEVISIENQEKQSQNDQILKVKKDAAYDKNMQLDKEAELKNLDSRSSIETLLSETEESNKRTIDKQLKNAKLMDEVYSVASDQAKDNANRTQDKQRELSKALNNVDEEVKIVHTRNTLGDDYSEGVTEEKFSQNGADGKIATIITRRIVVIDGHGEVYIRTQTKGVSTYKKNNEPISEYAWQKETQNSSLVRH